MIFWLILLNPNVRQFYHINLSLYCKHLNENNSLVGDIPDSDSPVFAGTKLPWRFLFLLMSLIKADTEITLRTTHAVVLLHMNIQYNFCESFSFVSIVAVVAVTSMTVEYSQQWITKIQCSWQVTRQVNSVRTRTQICGRETDHVLLVRCHRKM